MKLPKINSPEKLAALVDKVGFLPFFSNAIPGFSIEECVDDRYWFPADGDGVWEWKGPVIHQSGCAYGKFFEGKAAFICKEWFPDFANFRRQGYDMDALYDDGFAKRDDLDVWSLVQEQGSLLTYQIKELLNFGKEGRKGFEGIITRLQMQCYLITKDFDYRYDKHGNRYGWGVARYDTPEAHFGKSFTGAVYKRTPEKSEERLRQKLLDAVPKRYAAEAEVLLQKGKVKL